MGTEPVTSGTRDIADEKRLAHVLYILHALAPFTAWPLASFANILVAANRDDERGPFLDSHFG